MIHAGDNAIYTPRGGKPVLVRVERITAKRVRVIVTHAVERKIGNSVAVDYSYSTRYVTPARLERRGGGS